MGQVEDFKFVTNDDPNELPIVGERIVINDSLKESLTYNRDMQPLYTKNLYENENAFLILSGPSFASIDKTLLKKSGILTAGVNNSAFSFRPNIWFSADPPCNFLKSIWLDPTISKYVPIDNMHTTLFDSETENFLDRTPKQCPNISFYKRGTRFKAETFFTEDHVCWGNEADDGGKRSVMLVAIRLLHHFGIKNVYLLGCDFKMNQENPYHFKQYRHTSSVKGNNATYEALKERFELLTPYMEKDNFHIYNCNPNSGLKVFPYVPFEDAIQKCIPKYFPVNLSKEPTDGLYDRAYIERLTEKNANLHKISFCTVCMNRTHHLKLTYIKNIEDCMKFRPKIEFVLINYNSQDDMDAWVKDKLQIYIERGIVKYYKTNEPNTFKTSHSRNMAFRMATGDIIVNLDADNFLGNDFFMFVQKKMSEKTFIRKRGNSKGGRIAVWKNDFYNVNGFDEQFETWGQEDGDLCDRLERNGLRRVKSMDFDVIEHSNGERMQNYSIHDKRQSDLANGVIRSNNALNGVIKANPNGFGKGILFDFYGKREELS